MSANTPTTPTDSDPVKVSMTTGTKTCKPEAIAIWKIVFDLYKKQATGTAFDQLVHVSFKGGTPVEQKGIEATAANGINPKQADALVNEVGPAVLQLKDASTMTPDELAAAKKEVVAGSSKVANFALE